MYDCPFGGHVGRINESYDQYHARKDREEKEEFERMLSSSSVAKDVRELQMEIKDLKCEIDALKGIPSKAVLEDPKEEKKPKQQTWRDREPLL